MALTDNHFFALFGLHVSFDIDKVALKNTLLALQKQHHPDNHASQAQAEQNASLINHAYHTLSRDDERALYLLSLAGRDVNLDNSISDLEFLGQMIDIRSSLDDTDNRHQIKDLEKQVTDMMTPYATAFKTAYDQEAWERATDHAQKLKFLGKLQDDIIAKYTKLLSDGQSDDELYV